jgi:acyl carrier protein
LNFKQPEKLHDMSEIVFKKIATLLSTKKGVNKELISIDSTFEELGLDSLDSIELIADMEDEFNVTIPNTELQGIKSIRNAVDGLSKALNG